MNNLQDLVGLILPFLIDFVNRNIANSNLKFLVSMVACAGVAVLLNLDKLQSGSFEELLGKAGLIFTEAQVVYKLYWEKSQIRAKMI